MQRGHTTEKIVPRSDLGYDDGVLSMCRDETVDSPGCVRRVVSILEDLDPDGPCAVGRRWRDVDFDGTVVRRGNDVVYMID